MPHSTATTLTTDEIDDLIYFSRTGDLESLKGSIDDFSKAHSCSTEDVLTAAIDIDKEGLGSGSCLLHYPSANGNLKIVSYLLSLLQRESSGPASVEDGTSGVTNQRSATFVNRQNVSGNTALHWAGMNGHLQIVQALIKAGADPEIVNGAGRDAVVESEWSSKDGAAECAVWILKECGALEKGVGGEVGEAESSDRMAENGDVGPGEVEDDGEAADDVTSGPSSASADQK